MGQKLLIADYISRRVYRVRILLSRQSCAMVTIEVTFFTLWFWYKIFSQGFAFRGFLFHDSFILFGCHAFPYYFSFCKDKDTKIQGIAEKWMRKGQKKTNKKRWNSLPSWNQSKKMDSPTLNRLKGSKMQLSDHVWFFLVEMWMRRICGLAILDHLQ